MIGSISTTAGVALLACLFSPTSLLGQEKKKTDYSDAYRLIDKWLDAQRDYDRLPGLSVAIIDDQKLVWGKAYGLANPAGKGAARTDTIYSICSISKLFTAVAIMRLYDAGRLRLDDRIVDLLPDCDIKQQFDESGPITIRGILTHSAGLPRESDSPYWTGPRFLAPTREELMAKLSEQQTLYPSSTYFQYSNLGLALLGEVVRKVSGMPFERYVTENILKPLAMADTRTRLPPELWGKQLAVGHSARKRDGARDRLPLFQAGGLAAAYGLSSTVIDLGRFASWQFRLLNKGGQEILKAATLREMHRVQWMSPNWKTSWGLGFHVKQEDGHSVIEHGGSCPGYRSKLTLVPKHKLATVVMINASGTSPTLIDKGIRAILAKARKAKPPKKAKVEVDLMSFAGRFSVQPWGGELAVVPWNHGLAVIELPTREPTESMTLLRHVKGDVFRRVREKDDALGEEIRFERDAAGKVTRFWQHSNPSDRIR